MAQEATLIAEVLFTAANRVVAGGKMSARSAIWESCSLVHGKYSNESRLLHERAYGLHRQLFGGWDEQQTYAGGFTSGRWLNDRDRTALVLSLLFAYEYAVTEMLGDRVKLEEFVTQYYTIQDRAAEETRQLMLEMRS